MSIGQFFSQRFGYGVHALAYMAKKPTGQLTTLPELAEWMRTVWPNASETYLSNVVQRMARGRLLRSHRGIAGGYSLARPPETTTLRDLVELLEGIDINRCTLSMGDNCPNEKRCAIKRRLGHVESGFLEALQAVTFKDLAKDIEGPRPRSGKKKAARKTRV